MAKYIAFVKADKRGNVVAGAVCLTGFSFFSPKLVFNKIQILVLGAACCSFYCVFS